MRILFFRNVESIKLKRWGVRGRFVENFVKADGK